MNKIRIILVDDHKLFLEGLRELIDKQEDMEVVAIADNGEDLLIKMNAYYVDVVLLDIYMPEMNGIEAAKELQEKYPNTKVIAVSMYHEKAYIQKMRDYGVMGYLLKNTGRQELLEAIRAVSDGKTYFGNEIALTLLDNKKGSNPGTMPSLSKREREILVLIAKEYSNPDIAKQLHLSVETINTHRKNLLQKLSAKNTAGLVKYAIYNNML
ncbi:MAG: response regulator transcription factor [Chitinophagales bacterium]|nr:response regulator transcription factor [Chitinophagales bacterium]